MPHGRRKAAWLTIVLVLLAAELAGAGYLLFRTFRLWEQRSPGTPDVCSIVFQAPCDAALLAGASSVLGIPLAGWQLTASAALLCLLILAWMLPESFERAGLLAALMLAGLAAFFAAVLAGAMLAGKSVFCPLCLALHAANLLAVPALWKLSGRRWGEYAAALRAAGAYLLGREAGPAEGMTWKAIGLLNAALVAALVYQWVYVAAALRCPALPPPAGAANLIAEYEAALPEHLPVDATDPRLGPDRAPLQLLVFSSFQCPGCRQFAAELRTVRSWFPKEVTVVFKHYPLSVRCNPRLKTDRHPWSCDAAWAAAAAHQQGKFWEFHDALFLGSGRLTEEILQSAAEQAGLNLPRFEADRRADLCRAKVRDDVALGTRISLDATPAVFLNGRRVRDWTAASLEILIRHELAHRRQGAAVE